MLLSAYSCCPNRGSEPGIGWARAIETAKYCDTWVLTEGNDWEPIVSAHLTEYGPIPNLTFLFVRRRRWEKLVEDLPILNHLAYRRWQARAYRVAQRAHARIGFDLAHQVTFNSFRSPSYLHRLSAPFVWGPIGGAQYYPFRFLVGAGATGALLEATRNFLTYLQLNLSRRVREAACRAAIAYAANSENKRCLSDAIGLCSALLCDVGVPEPPEISKVSRADAGPLRILWSGVLSTRKALELLIEALAQLPDRVSYELRVVGDGPARRRWQALAQKRGVSQRVRWCGRVSHAEALEQYGWADLFAFTSLRDTSGTVLLEAMSASVPIICLDHQGAGDVVTHQCGVKIPITTRSAVQRRLRNAIVELHDDRERLATMGLAARERVAAYVWSAQTTRIVSDYNKILEASGSDARCVLRDDVGIGHATAIPLTSAVASEVPSGTQPLPGLAAKGWANGV